MPGNTILHRRMKRHSSRALGMQSTPGLAQQELHRIALPGIDAGRSHWAFDTTFPTGWPPARACGSDLTPRSHVVKSRNAVRVLAVVLALAGALLAQVPRSSHVVVVAEENHSYASITSTSMPYLYSLATKYGLATSFYAVTHPSIGNYFMLTTGQIITNSDGYTGTVSADNIVRHMLTSAVTWKSYAEGLPYVGYTGGDTGYYMKHHNPFAYFTDVVNSTVQKNNLVPFSHFATDLANGTLPEFSYVVPNSIDDAHSGSLGAADNWLKTHIAPLLANAQFQQDGLLVVWFDESYSTDTTYGGGHIFVAVIGPKVPSGKKDGTLYKHQNLLRTIMEALGMTTFPGAAASVSDMGAMFTATTATVGSSTPPPPSTSTCTLSTVSPSVTICSPGSSFPSTSVAVKAGSTDKASAVWLMQVYVDGSKKYEVQSNAVNTTLSMTVGTHRVTVQAYDKAGAIFKSTVYTTVQ